MFNIDIYAKKSCYRYWDELVRVEDTRIFVVVMAGLGIVELGVYLQ
jgi:hypothetical protein